MKNQTKPTEKQKKICEKYGSEFMAMNQNDMLAIAIDSIGQQPISGRREVKVTNDPNEITWFIYCGEYNDADDFFSPIHVSHLEDILPEVLPYLAWGLGSKIHFKGFSRNIPNSTLYKSSCL